MVFGEGFPWDDQEGFETHRPRVGRRPGRNRDMDDEPYERSTSVTVNDGTVWVNGRLVSGRSRQRVNVSDSNGHIRVSTGEWKYNLAIGVGAASLAAFAGIKLGYLPHEIVVNNIPINTVACSSLAGLGLIVFGVYKKYSH